MKSSFGCVAAPRLVREVARRARTTHKSDAAFDDTCGADT